MTDGLGIIIREIPEFLEWKGYPEFIDKVDGIYFNILGKSLGSRLIPIKKKDPASATLLIQKLTSLPDEAFLRVLIAPETNYRILENNDKESNNLISFLTESINAEYYRLKPDTEVPKGTWTALGDMYFPEGSTTQSSSGNFQNGNPHLCKALPRLTNGIIIDFLSPYSKRPIDKICIQEDVTEDELDITIDKLERSFHDISKISKLVYEFILHFTKVIILKKDTTDCKSSSSSTKGFMGRIELINPHLESVNTAVLANALIHETILVRAVEPHAKNIRTKEISAG